MTIDPTTIEEPAAGRGGPHEELMTVAYVDAVARAFHAGVANRDTAALTEMYHHDARLLAPNMEPAEGSEAIKDAWQAMLDIGACAVEVEPIDVRKAGNLTIEYGRYTLGLEADGETMSDVGKYLVVHETREDGSTKILFDCFNSNSPPAG
jgi:ketosteroid isomerase-like protein